MSVALRPALPVISGKMMMISSRRGVCAYTFVVPRPTHPSAAATLYPVPVGNVNYHYPKKPVSVHTHTHSRTLGSFLFSIIILPEQQLCRPEAPIR